MLQPVAEDVHPLAVRHRAAGHSVLLTQSPVVAAHVALQLHDVPQCTPNVQAEVAQDTLQGPAPHLTPDVHPETPHVRSSPVGRLNIADLTEVEIALRYIFGI